MDFFACSKEGTSNAEIIVLASYATEPLVDTYSITLQGFEGDDTLKGSSGPRDWADFWQANPAKTVTISNFLDGGDGNDRLISSEYSATLPLGAKAALTFEDFLVGGLGDDTYVLHHSAVYIDDFGGSDTIILAANFAGVTSYSLFRKGIETLKLAATLGNFTLTGNDFDNLIVDGNGNSQIYGEESDDTLFGRGGDDKIYGGNANDVLYGGAGNDLLETGNEAPLVDIFQDNIYGIDRLFGGAGDDTITGTAMSWGNSGYYSLYGGDGDDMLTSLDDKGKLYGGAGADTLIGHSWDTLSGGAGNDVLSAEGYSLNHFYGGEGDDSLSGYSSDTMYGGSGNDVLNVGSYSSLIGGTGDDVLTGSETCTLQGGEGNDTISSGGYSVVHGGAGEDSVLGQRADMIFGGAGNDWIISGGASQLNGGDGDDTLFALFKDTLSGEAGNDLLYGGVTSNILVGGSGDDTLVGRSSDDTIEGGSGNDVLFGGFGSNTLSGGDGADIFAFDFATGDPGFGQYSDTIRDFLVGQDRIDLSSFAIDPTSAVVTNGSADFTSIDGSYEILLASGSGSTNSLEIYFFGARLFIIGFGTASAEPLTLSDFIF